MIKQLSPFNPSLSSFPSFHVKNVNSLKSLTNLQQKQSRLYTTTNNYVYYDNINRNNNVIDLSPSSIKIIRDRLKTSRMLNYKFNYDATKKIREASVLVVIRFLKIYIYIFLFH